MGTIRNSGTGPQADPSPEPPADPAQTLMSKASARRFVLALLGAVAAAAWLPILAVLATAATAVATGCQVDEAAVHPCIVAGHDIGDALGTGLLLVFVAAPATLVALGASVLWVVLWRRHRQFTACAVLDRRAENDV